MNKALEEVKATRDEAISMADSLKSEQERLIRVAREEAKKKMVKAIFKKEEAIKALEKKRADQKVVEMS